MGKYGLIGDPIAKSLSPALFKAGYGGSLQYDLIEGSDFVESWKKFLEEYDAINVTAPFKENAFNQVVALSKDGLGGVSGPCWKIGATNLVVKTEDGIMAHNSDFTGIILCVGDALWTDLTKQCYGAYGDRGYVKVHQFVKEYLQERYGRVPQALIVGCGGAGKAAAIAAAEMGYNVVLMNRTAEKAQSFALDVSEYGFIVDSIDDFRGAFRECDLVIYTLPMKLNAIEALEVADFRNDGSEVAGVAAPPKIILEANYKNPSFAGAMGKIQEAGATYIHGSQWLLNQALTGYGLMTGQSPDYPSMALGLQDAIGR